MNKLFECFWGDGYRSNSEPLILETHKQTFFDSSNGYTTKDVELVELLSLGERIELNECGEHWVRRIK